jgi:hypothetical protein
MSTSETVQAAQRPAPEFIVSPIVCPGTPDAHTLTLKIGTQSFRINGHVDFDTREEAEWMADQLLRALANMKQPARCECRDRPAALCPGTWEPGCDMGASEAMVPGSLRYCARQARARFNWKFSPAKAEEQLREALRYAPRHDGEGASAVPVGSPGAAITPPTAFCDIARAAVDAAGRAAYLARWANAPAEATHLSEGQLRRCRWWKSDERGEGPVLTDYEYREWSGCEFIGEAGMGLIGRVACEARPQQAVDPEHAAYLKRWEGAPEWATHATQDQGKECRWWRNQPSEYLTGVGKAATDTLEAYAPDNILGAVRCEPRPDVQP